MLASNRWPFRLHATYDESITRFLNVFEDVNREIPFDGLRWFFDHAETVSARNLERVAALRGGVAVQDRMAFQGERFVERYGLGYGFGPDWNAPAEEVAARIIEQTRRLAIAVATREGQPGTRRGSRRRTVLLLAPVGVAAVAGASPGFDRSRGFLASRLRVGEREEAVSHEPAHARPA